MTQSVVSLANANLPVPTLGLTLSRMFLATAERRGEAVALRRKELGVWRGMTWSAYAQEAKAVAGALLAWGLEVNQSVAVLGENRPEWVISDQGIMLAAGVTAAIYATNAAEGVQYVLDHSDSRFVILENIEQLDKVLEVRANCPKLERIIVMDSKGLLSFKDPFVLFWQDFLSIGQQWLQNPSNAATLEARIASRLPNDPALFIYTSGTTGRPKGAVLSHKNLVFASGAMANQNPMFETDEVLSFLPLSHITERMLSVAFPSRYGFVVNFVESPDMVLQNLYEIRPTIFFAVPRIWEKIMSGIETRMIRADLLKKVAFRWATARGREMARAKLELRSPSVASNIAYLGVLRSLKQKLGLDRARFVLSGSAPIAPSVLEFFHGLGVQIREGYGQTEGAAAATIHQGFPFKLGSVGQALPGIEIKIAADGEIIMRGDHVFLGYHKDEKATAETVRDGWLHSGDIGELDEVGNLTITGRKKDIFITAAGKNIAPAFIENKLKASSFINDSVLIGDAKKFLTALIILDEETVSDWAQSRKIPFTTYTDLVQNEQVVKLIEGEIETVNKTLARAEQVKKFRILPKKLAQEDGDVTPTLKVKRASILKTYAGLIEEMYKGGGGE
jgi:long-chain acyl-CoA synthetase